MGHAPTAVAGVTHWPRAAVPHVLWYGGSEDIQAGFRTTEQCPRHTQRDKIDKGTLDTAGVTQEGQVRFSIAYRQR